MAQAYDYLSLTLPRGRAAWQAFADHVHGPGSAVIAGQGGEVVGLFTPQLGFASNEAVVLIRWPENGRGSVAPIAAAPGVVACHDDALTPTVRPADGKAPRAGGIYVHRWFTVDGDRVADFIDLSNRAWAGFEGTYGAEIFGLFSAAPTPHDLHVGEGRLLLLTWYASHGVWEESREQTIDPEGLFVKRHLLTRTTIGRSSLLVPRP
jgi:hypothetical protein